MNLRQIRYFLALCEEHNFTRAARLCHVSQPSLSNAIGALETELGGQLFHRKPFVRPSELAKRLRPHFESIVEAVDVTPQIVVDFSTRPLTDGVARFAQVRLTGRHM
jgi:DNA-binding transcriptional LysR family regulator